MIRRRVYTLLLLAGLVAVAAPAAFAQQGPITAAWTSATAGNTTATIGTLGYGVVSVSFNPSGSFSGGVFTFEMSDDGGTTWYPAGVVSSTGGSPITTFTLTATATLWQGAVPGATNFRVRLSTAITGASTAIIRLNAYPGTGFPIVNPPSVTLAANQTVNETQYGGSAVIAGGPAGSQAVGGVSADNSSITQNPVVTAGRAQSSGSLVTFATAGNQRQIEVDLAGAQFVRLGSSQDWHCDLTGVAASLTQCLAAPAAGVISYVTDITVDTTTSTAGTYYLSYGTGSNCGTGTNRLWPINWSVTAPVLGAPQKIHFQTPITPVAANAVCVFGTATNTINISLEGYYAP